MLVKTLTPKGFGANCYIVIEDENSLIIDPSVDVATLKRVTEGTKVAAIFITHGHFDHIYFLKEAQQEFGVPIYLHEHALEKLSDPRRNYSVVTEEKFVILPEEIDYKLLKDNEILTDVFPKSIQVLETFGHTNCSVSFVIERSLFTGDLLFFENVGRTDLYTSDFSSLLRSLKNLANLKGEYTVYPGHGKPTKLSHERSVNPYFSMQ